jgi:four helix bundle protein
MLLLWTERQCLVMATRDATPEIHSYRDLLAWQSATQLAVAVHRATEEFPSTQRFGLSAQLQRAAVSVASNIAEGHGQWSRGQYIRYLGIARGSLKEVETQLEIARQLKFLSEEKYAELQRMCDRTSRLLTNLRRALAKK